MIRFSLSIRRIVKKRVVEINLFCTLMHINRGKMKKWFFLVILTAFWGCQQNRQQVERLTVVMDSLKQVASEKDSTIVDFLAGFNEIQENLDSIKAVEKLVTLSSSG